MASNDAFLFSQQDLMSSSYTMFYDMKKKEELIDVSIRIDNKVISAHRIILAAAVPYFRTMFTSNLAESKQKEVAMKGLDPAALEGLIDFAYTSQVKITAENVQSVLVASEYLQLTKVRDRCCDFLSQRLDPKNVIHVRTLADSLNCLSLVKNSDSYIKKNFDAFSQTKEFLSLSFTFLNDLIRKDDLEASSEEKVFDAVMKWVKTDAKRQTMLPNLLTNVRMTFLSTQFLVKKASKEKLIMDSVPCRNLLDEAKNYHLLQEEGASGCSFVVSERCYSPETACGIYLFCSNKTSGLTIFKYTTTTMKWNTVLNDKSRTDVQHVLSADNEIYVFRRNAFETFNPQTMAWTPRATFPSTYSNFNHAISCNGKIYWFGCGKNYNRIHFDSQQNLWVSGNQNFEPYADDELVPHGYEVYGEEFVPHGYELYDDDDDDDDDEEPVPHGFELYADDELVPHGNIVYVLGSHHKLGSRGRNAIYRCNLQTSVLSEISMPDDRVAFGGAICGDSLFLCGGIRHPDRYASSYRHWDTDNKDEVLRTTTKYSSPCEWLTVPSMNKSRKNFSLLTYEKQLYAIGGTTDGSDPFEVYDTAADKWTFFKSPLDGNYNFVKAVVISDEKNKSG